MIQQRQTKQKEIIHSALCALGNHPTADSVYEKVHASYPSISRATVFRVLNQMAENGTVLRVRIAGAADRYDHSPKAHCHARCVKCGKLFDLPLICPELPVEIPGKLGDFSVTGYILIFEGLCRACLDTEESED